MALYFVAIASQCMIKMHVKWDMFAIPYILKGKMFAHLHNLVEYNFLAGGCTEI